MKLKLSPKPSEMNGICEVANSEHLSGELPLVKPLVPLCIVLGDCCVLLPSPLETSSPAEPSNHVVEPVCFIYVTVTAQCLQSV